jgi:hypothetical protein
MANIGQNNPTANDSGDRAAEGAALIPNRIDINNHLYALFHPDFVQGYPEGLIRMGRH